MSDTPPELTQEELEDMAYYYQVMAFIGRPDTDEFDMDAAVDYATHLYHDVIQTAPAPHQYTWNAVLSHLAGKIVLRESAELGMAFMFSFDYFTDFQEAWNEWRETAACDGPAFTALRARVFAPKRRHTDA